MSGDASASSSGNLAENFFTSPPPPKKKRNLPGNPDPDAEVLSLSPKTLMATNRFVCEICNKGFQRDQNLQLHRRGHNLPWKLKQRNSKDVVRKKVYVCPEETCVHHHPSRALGDLTGIKKHFSRKHGEKKWKCDKCSKRYAVHSDWKAHSKTCGTREYRCDCGTLFSRRDSFITHRAFCDALAEESARTNPILIPSPHHQISNPLSPSSSQINTFSKNETGTFLRPDLPPWLSAVTPNHDDFVQTPDYDTQNRSFLQYHHFPTSSSPSVHMSATALLQKAAQIGAASPAGPSSSMAGLHHMNHTPEIGVGGSHEDTAVPSSSELLMEVMSSLSSAGGFESASFGELLEGGNDGLTRDFLGLRALSHCEIMNIAGLGNCINTPPLPRPPPSDEHHQDQKPWQG